MGSWFYVQDGKQWGPIPWETLRSLAASGQLKPGDLVWMQTMTDWTPASSVEGLFGTAPASPPPVSSDPYAVPSSTWIPQGPQIPSGIPLPEIVPGSEELGVTACIGRASTLLGRHFGIILLTGLIWWALMIGAGLVCGVMDSVLGLPPSVISVGSQGTHLKFGPVTTRYSTDPELNPSTTVTTNPAADQVTSLPSQILQQVLSVFLSLGCTRIGLNLVSGKPASVDMIFGEGRKLLRGIGASILYWLMVGIGLILLIVPGIYLAMRFGMYREAIVDRDLGVMESFNYSARITSNNCMNLFALAVLNFFILLAGALLCGVGLIYAFPLVWLAGFVAYRWLQYGPGAAMDQPGTTRPLLADV